MHEERISLAAYRMDTAEEKVEAALLLLKEEKFKDAANRAYYAIFHAMRAILALEGVDFKKHSGVISHFRQHYVMTGVFDNSMSDIIGRAFLIRNQSDYEDYYVISKSDAIAQCEDARLFCDTVKAYLEDRIGLKQ